MLMIGYKVRDTLNLYIRWYPLHLLFILYIPPARLCLGCRWCSTRNVSIWIFSFLTSILSVSEINGNSKRKMKWERHRTESSSSFTIILLPVTQQGNVKHFIYFCLALSSPVTSSSDVSTINIDCICQSSYACARINVDWIQCDLFRYLML